VTETSAKSGLGVDELHWAVRDNIAWGDLPKVSTNALFKAGKAFLLDLKPDET
jgi:hypothetical protein